MNSTTKLEIQYTPHDKRRKSVADTFEIKDIAKHVCYPNIEQQDFWEYLDVITTNTGVFRYPSYMEHVATFQFAKGTRITVDTGLRAWHFFMALLEWCNNKRVLHDLREGQFWWEDTRKAVFTHGLSDLPRLESTVNYEKVLAEYRGRNPVQYNFYRHIMISMTDKTKSKVLDKVYPERVKERKERAKREKQRQMREQEIEKQKAEFNEHTRNLYTFVDFLSSSEQVTNFHIDGFIGKTSGHYISGYKNSSGAWELTSIDAETGKHDYITTSNENTLERWCKCAYTGCFGNDRCRVVVEMGGRKLYAEV